MSTPCTCSCTGCRTAHSRPVTSRADQRAARFAYTAEHGLPVHVQHGTPNAHDNWGCKCDTCRTAATERRAARRNAART